MKKKILIGLAMLVLGAAASQAAATWEARVSTSESPLNDVCFIDQFHGWAVGDGGVILKTIDRGLNWVSQESGTTEDLKSVRFVSPTEGWAVGTTRTVVKYDGTAWTKTQIPHAVDIDLSGLYLTGSGKLWVAAPGFSTFGDPTKYHNFFHSLNGGTTWESINIRNSTDLASTLNYLYATYFLNDSVGWVVGTNSLASPTGKIFKTTDEAVTWQDVSPAGADNVYFYDIYFSSDTTGWAVGGDTTTGIGYIYSSTDGGATWGTSPWTFNPASFKRISPDGGGDLWVANSGDVFNYSGGNWSENARLLDLGTGLFNGINFVDPWNGWAVGGLLASDPGGPKRYIYKYVVSPYALVADRSLYITSATYEATLAFSGANIQSNATLTLEALAGVTLGTYEVKPETALKYRIDAQIQIEPGAAEGTYGFTITNTDEGTSGNGIFVLHASASPVNKPTAQVVPAKIFDPSTSNSITVKIATPGQLTANGVRTSSVPPDVELELVGFRSGSHSVAWRQKFFSNQSGFTDRELQKITDTGLEVSDGIYTVWIIHPRFGKIGSGTVVVQHSK